MPAGTNSPLEQPAASWSVSMRPGGCWNTLGIEVWPGVGTNMLRHVKTCTYTYMSYVCVIMYANINIQYIYIDIYIYSICWRV